MEFDLQAFIDQEIPITGAMGIDVVHNEESSLLMRAPLAPNHNDKGTAFAGSLYAVAALCAWGYTTSLLKRRGISVDVAVVESQVRFLRPVRDTFEAECRHPGETAVAKLCDALAKKGRGRLELEVVVRAEGVEVLRFSGSYAAMRREPSEQQ